MKYLIGLLLLFSQAHAAESYVYLELGVGGNTNITGASIPWENAGNAACVAELGYVHQINKRWWGKARILHLSQCFAGPPFNDKKESSVDHIGISLQYRWDL